MVSYLGRLQAFKDAVSRAGRAWFSCGGVYRSLAVLLVVVGMTFRIRQYLFNRPLWLDEALMALNILERDFAGLMMGRLSYYQAPPVGFMWVAKALGMLFDYSELALRAFPLVASCLALVVFVLVARRMMSWPAVLIGLAALVFSPLQTYYASEFKPYASDVLFAELLLLAGFACSENGGRRALWGLIVIGWIAPWFSSPAIIVMIAVGSVLCLQMLCQRDWTRLTRLVLVGVAWGAGLGLLYAVSLHWKIGDQALLHYWRKEFSKSQHWTEIPGLLLDLLKNPMDFGRRAWLPVALMFLGWVAAWRDKGWKPLMLTLIPVVALVFSMMSWYPFYQRMLLFMTPVFFMFFGKALDLLPWRAQRRDGRQEHDVPVVERARTRALRYSMLFVVGLFVMASLWSLRVGMQNSWHRFYRDPFVKEDVRTALKACMRRYRRSTDNLYVFERAQYAFLYYAYRYGIKPRDYSLGSSHVGPKELYREELEALSDKPRLWMLFSHDMRGQERIVRREAKANWPRLQFQQRENGGSVVLYVKP
jgi:hypothetical protein